MTKTEILPKFEKTEWQLHQEAVAERGNAGETIYEVQWLSRYAGGWDTRALAESPAEAEALMGQFLVRHIEHDNSWVDTFRIRRVIADKEATFGRRYEEVKRVGGFNRS